MIITTISAVQPPTPAAPDDWRTQLGQVLVKVQTDSGVCGFGVGGGGSASIHVIETVLSDLLVGQDPSEVEQLHNQMCCHTAFYGRKGLVVMAISGVDLALWDIRGKVNETSVAKLLNTNVDFDLPIPTYTTVFDDEQAKTAIEAGHQAIKLHVERFGDRPSPAEIGSLVNRTRNQLGADAQIMVDAFARWDLDTTLRVADEIVPHGVTWLEEPLGPDDLDGYAVLMANSPVPIAGGEHEYLRVGFRQLIDGKLHAILQPDINWCGGLTTLVEIYRMANDAGIRVCPHRGCEPYALPAIAAFDRMPLAESPRSWFTCLHGAPQITKGIIRTSRAHGFGISVDEAIWSK